MVSSCNKGSTVSISPNIEFSSVEEGLSSENLILPELQDHQPSLWARIMSKQWVKPRRIIDDMANEKSNHAGFTHRGGRMLLLRNLLILGLAFCGAVMLGLRTFSAIKQATTTPISCDCGRSIAEAEAMGCKYDTMAASWLTEACRDDELSAEFDKAGPGPGGKWYYWADSNKSRELSIHELSHIADIPYGVFYTESAWHVAHCTYYWRKQWRGIAYLPPESTYGHIVHCEKVIFGDQEAIIVSGVGLNSSTNT
jgi:hypothetical protein